jgi:type II secretory pathway component PulF
MTGTRLSTSGADRLTEHLGDLVASGLPLAQGLAAIAPETPDRRTRLAFTRLAARLEAGATLGEALADDRLRLPLHLRALIEAGVRSDRLPEILAQVAGEAGIGRQIRTQFLLSLIYPALLIGFTSALFGLLSLVPGAALENIALDFGLKFPAGVEQLTAISTALLNMGAWIVLGPVLLLGAGGVLVRLLFSPPERRSLLMRVPLIGTFFQATALADFFRVLSWLVDAETPLTEALALAGEGAGDPAIRAACDQAASGIERGQSLAEALAAAPPFPNGLGAFLDWADDTRSPGDALRVAAALFEIRADSHARFASVLLTVLVLALLSTTVLFVVLGLVVPVILFIRLLGG